MLLLFTFTWPNPAPGLLTLVMVVLPPPIVAPAVPVIRPEALTVVPVIAPVLEMP